MNENNVALQSDCVYDFYCEYCKENGLNTEAVGYCVDCDDYLCQGCINAHKRPRPSRHHEILDQNKMPREVPLFQDRVNREILTKCKVHNNKIVEYYCVSHGELVCNACFFKVHRHCNEIQSILEESERIIGSHVYDEFSESLKDIETRSCAMTSKTHENRAESARLTAKATTRIKSFRAEVNALFDEMEKSLLDQIEEVVSEDDAAMVKMTETLTDISDRAKALISETDKLATSKQVCKLFIQIKEKQRDLVILKEKLCKADECDKVRMVEFEANNNLRTAFKATGLGKIKIQTRCANAENKTQAIFKKDGDHKTRNNASFLNFLVETESPQTETAPVRDLYAVALISETDKLATSKQVCKLFIQIKEKQRDLVILKEKLCKADECDKVRMVEFEANNNLRTAFKATGLGKIKIQTRCANADNKTQAIFKKDGDHKTRNNASFLNFLVETESPQTETAPVRDLYAVASDDWKYEKLSRKRNLRK